MKKIIFLLIPIFAAMMSCKHESLDDRAEREAREYTEKCCPTPEINNSHIDSIVFDRKSRALINYCTVSGEYDNETIMTANEKKIIEGISSGIKSDPKNKTYRDAGIAIRYILRSASDPKKVWVDTTVK